MSNWTRTGTVESSGYRAEYRVTQHGRGYRVETTVPNALHDVTVGSGTYFSKDTAYAGGGVVREASRRAHKALLNALDGAKQDNLYVRVDGLPGYARESVRHLTGGMVEAAYRMNHDTGVPTTVFRVFYEDLAQVEKFRAEVEGRNFAEDARDFGTAKVTVTRDVLAAVDSPWYCTEGVAYFAARFAAAAKGDE